MIQKLIIFLMLLMLAPALLNAETAQPSAKPPLTRGIEAYHQGLYQKSYNLLAPLAEKNVPSANFYMGFFYGRGLIVKRANKEAQLYFIRGKNRMMEQQGLLYAFPYEIKLAKMYQEGTMLDKNPWGAFIIFSEWARNGHPESLYQTAHAMEVGYPVKEDLKDAAHYYLLAAQKGYAPAMTSIARLYFFGRGVDRDLQAALDWIKKAIKLGNKEAIVLSLYYNATDGNQKVIALNYARIAVEVAKVKEPSFVPEAIKLYQKTLKYLSKKDLLIAQDTYPIFQELQKYMLQRRKNWFK